MPSGKWLKVVRTLTDIQGVYRFLKKGHPLHGVQTISGKAQ